MSTMIGIGMALFGGLIQSIGFILQKKGHNKVNKQSETDNKTENKTDTDTKSVTQIPIWWFGIITYQIGNALRAISLSFAPQSIISPLLAFNISVNSILAHFFLKEYISKKDIIAIIGIIIGIIMLIIFGPSTSNDDDDNMTISELKTLFKQTNYIVFVSCLTGIMCINFIFSKYIEYKNFASDNNKQIMNGKNFLLISYTAIAGYFRANNTLFIKSLMVIISSSFESKQNNQQNLNDYTTYLIAILWIICLLNGEYFRQKALSYFGASYVIPLDILFSVIFSVFLGGFFFNEFNNINSILYIILFFIGLFITLLSVFILSYDIASKIDEIIKMIYIKNNEQCQKSKVKMVDEGILSEYFAAEFLQKIPFFVNVDVSDGNDQIQKNNEIELKAAHNTNPSFSWQNMSANSVMASRTYLQSKLIWILQGSFIFILSIFIFSKFKISFYHFISIWIILWNVALILFLCRAFMSSNLREIRSKSTNLNGFSHYISFSNIVDDIKDSPITSVCRFAGVRGSSQEMIFSIYILGEVALAMTVLAIKTNERGQDLFTDKYWNQGRRTDIMLLIEYPMVIALFLLYIIAVVEHGSIGHRIHLFCGMISMINPPIAFIVQQNGSISSIICMTISIVTIAVYKINGRVGVTKSNDIATVHKWSLINLTVEAIMIIWVCIINALTVWAMDGDKIF